MSAHGWPIVRDLSAPQLRREYLDVRANLLRVVGDSLSRPHMERLELPPLRRSGWWRWLLAAVVLATCLATCSEGCR